MARKKIIAGNWKMNMTPSEAVALVNTLNTVIKRIFRSSKKDTCSAYQILYSIL